MYKQSVRVGLITSTAFCFLFAASPARADVPLTPGMQAFQNQIASLQQQLNAMQAQMKAQAAAQATTQAAVNRVAGAGHGLKDVLPGVRVTLGGFFETDGIYRTKNETTDVASNFNTLIPFNNSVQAHQGEFRGTARATRLTLLVDSNVDEATKVQAYLSADFLGAADTSSSTETNSYIPRLREAYTTIDRSDYGLHVLVGQSWSLLTTDEVGITPRKEAIPGVIDAAYIAGYNYTRGPEARITKDFFDREVVAGLELASPQALPASGAATTIKGVNIANGGNALLTPGYTNSAGTLSGTYTTDFAPDILGKIAFDPGYGHYEVFELTRFFHDNVNFHNNDYSAFAGGAAVILPIIEHWVELHANFLGGQGVGRYSAGQLPDFAVSPNGTLKPLTEFTGLVGLTTHPTSTIDVNMYAGGEKVLRDNVIGGSTITYGYGNLDVNNKGCNVENGTCKGAETANIWELTSAVWDKVYDGRAGILKVGVQYALNRRNAFSDEKGVAPHAYENTTLVAFRYYPKY